MLCKKHVWIFLLNAKDKFAPEPREGTFQQQIDLWSALCARGLLIQLTGHFYHFIHL